MKNMNDIADRLRMELKVWFKRQCEGIYEDFYLYYLPTTGEHDGGILIVRDAPANPEYLLAAKVRRDLSIEDNHKILLDVCRHLPILEI